MPGIVSTFTFDVHGCTNDTSAGMRRSGHILFLDGVYAVTWPTWQQPVWGV
jgi:hypothetical protein